MARHNAALLVGADLSGASPVHCFRWPGSAHTKDPAHPVRCEIERIDERAEVHLEEAAERLVEAVHANHDRAVALSLILTAITRSHLPSAPLHGFDAPLAGSDKSKLVDIASILANGHEAGVIAQGESREETEKRLSTLLMRGDPPIAIDNCELPLEGDLINQALTQTVVNLRILGQSQAVRARCASLITATGNNLTLKGDLTRRGLVSRLDPKCERPELKQFDYNPIADAKENRGQLVADALAILRAYAYGRPNPLPQLQGFAEWSNTIRSSLIWLGEADTVKTMDRLRETDPLLANLKAVLTAWRDQFADASTTTNDAAGAINATQAAPQPGTLDRLRDALLVVAGRSGKVEIRLLGHWLGKNFDRVVDLGDGDLVVLKKAGLLHGAQQWRVGSVAPKVPYPPRCHILDAGADNIAPVLQGHLVAGDRIAEGGPKPPQTHDAHVSR